MGIMNYRHYRSTPVISLPDRTWPNKTLIRAPEWVSVDLRDGNQALETPMSLEEKIEFYHYLLSIGFKTIEIGFPAASETEYDFARHLIENDLIPDDVTIQVLTQSRPHIIEKTFAAVSGAPNVVVHLYNSTSVVQREVVFDMSKSECIALAVRGARQILELACADRSRTHYTFQYSPESYAGTEDDFAVEICDAVCDVWQPAPDRKVIINLPTTVECTTPNVYADRLEYFLRKTRWKDEIRLCIHAHNDRGTGVATTELGLLAGAERVEGTLFGNGERTGNADLMTLALNLMSQGIDPGLDFTDLKTAVALYERLTGMHVNPRHPYAGELVYTAFSGSHQDAISKGMAVQKDKKYWEVPYLPIDPADVGRSYDPIIRINSQSGKGGVGYILKQNYGLDLPKEIVQAFSQAVTRESDRRHSELDFAEIYDFFRESYVNITNPLALRGYSEEMISEDEVKVVAVLEKEGREITDLATGNGLVAAFCNMLEKEAGGHFQIISYHQHALTTGRESQAISYVMIKDEEGGKYIGAGISGSISKASLRAVISAINKRTNTLAAK